VARRSLTSAWRKVVKRTARLIQLSVKPARKKAPAKALRASPPRKRTRSAPANAKATTDSLAGVVVGLSGTCRYQLYRPPGLQAGETRPLMVMLHGCGQNADSFARSTRMNRVAARGRFFVLYPTQDRLANPQGCWNWYDTRTGRAYQEAALILKALDQVSRLYPVNSEAIGVAGMSAGASMAALLATRYPERFRAVVMHSGVPPGMAHSPLSALGAMGGRPARQAVQAVSDGPPAEPGHWPPLLAIHGQLDPVVSVHNAEAAVAQWAQAGEARALPTRRVQRGQRRAMAITEHRHRGCSVATLVTIEGMGHAWSGGASGQPFSDPTGPDASAMAWAFLLKQCPQPKAP
jgi:poly(hydroxyalkanoate) depolymerase family esterase